jgi:DNA replication protein DnaC
MEAREITASMKLIPLELRRKLNPELLAPFLTGELPEKGFGISGPPGTGKTMTLAALFHHQHAERIRRYAPTDPAAARARYLLWVDWPTRVSEFRGSTGRDGGLNAIETQVQDMVNAPALVIDDLGSERLRGAYHEDFAIDLLLRVVNLRYRQLKPVFWTSNRTDPELQERYGSRFVSRLLSDYPRVDSHGIKDQRFTC